MSNREQILKEHSEKYISNLISRIYYTNILSVLFKKVGAEKAKEHLFQIGQEIAHVMLSIWDPETENIEKLVKKVFKKIWKKKVKVKIVFAENKIIYHIIDKKCSLCDPESAIEGVNIPCVAVAGFLDVCMQQLSKKVSLPSYEVRTVKSILLGNEFCEHQIEVMK